MAGRDGFRVLLAHEAAQLRRDRVLSGIPTEG
jgi:hypothetical protein